MHQLQGFFAAVGLAAVAACGGGSSTTPPPEDVETQSTTQVAGPAPAPAEPVSPIPEGYHSVTPMLAVGDVARALGFYQTAFGAEQTELVVDPDSGAALHAEVRIGDSIVMLSPENDRGSRSPATAGGTCGALLVYVEDVDAAFTRATEAGATSVMPVADMFWGDRYGQVQDPFGHRWGIATHKFELPDEEIARRGEAWSTAMARRRRAPRFPPGEPASSWRPEGFFTVTPSLVVSGPDDVAFFVQAFGAEERSRMVDSRGQLAHAEVRIGDSIVMLTGEEAREPHMKTAEHLGATPVSLMLYVPDVDSAFATATGAGATERSPVTEMFWGDRLGMVTARAGHVVGIATHVADVTPEEMTRRMREHRE